MQRDEKRKANQDDARREKGSHHNNSMSALSNKISQLRGEDSVEKLGARAGISRQSLFRIQRGESVKLDTLRRIARAYELTEADWLDLLAAWLYTEAGVDGRKLLIEPRSRKPSALREGEEELLAHMLSRFRELPSTDRQQVLLCMERTEVRRALASMNQLFDAVKLETSPNKKTKKGRQYAETSKS